MADIIDPDLGPDPVFCRVIGAKEPDSGPGRTKFEYLRGPSYVVAPKQRLMLTMDLKSVSPIVVTGIAGQARNMKQHPTLPAQVIDGPWGVCDCPSERCAIGWAWFEGNYTIDYRLKDTECTVARMFFNESHNVFRLARLVVKVYVS